MQSRVERGTTRGGGYAELGIVTAPNGQEYSALGAIIGENRIACYWSENGLLAHTWGGECIGTIRVISSRPAIFFGRRSCWSNRYYYVRVHLNDRRIYLCRGFGPGMLLTGKRIKGT